jgi:pimeloyl-ACP methyl ester carboxylesterase
MAQVHANGIDIEYEAFGDPEAPPLLLIIGMSAQLTSWPEPFCRDLAERGHYVVRFDNRDAGLSTGLEGELSFDDLLRGVPAPYGIPDMAADTLGLMDALGFRAAHLVGVSLGGMIAQQIAIDRAERVLSLCSIMATTGDPAVGQPSEAAIQALLAPAGSDRDSAVERNVRWHHAIGSPGYPASDSYLRARAAAGYDRAYRPEGGMRHIAAILQSKDRTEGLRGVSAPTLVLHGEDDPLVNMSGGKATAAAVPGAELRLFSGMGHDLPEPLWGEFATAIAANAAKSRTAAADPGPVRSVRDAAADEGERRDPDAPTSP